MKRILFVLMILLSAAGLAFADTIYLRDGRTVRGTLLGFANGRFIVRVERRYATNSTSTTESDVARNRGDQGDIQYFRPEEIERIEIEGRSLDDARYETRNVQVTLDSNWTDSGVYLHSGERVQISASGVISVGRSRISPEGLRSNDPTAPLPDAAEGELIGAIGNDPRAPIIELGSTREFTADRNGRLFLTANRGSYTDARGAFEVEIRSQRDLNARNDDFERGGTRSRNRDTGASRGNQRERTLAVPANSRGADTGIDVRAGEPITITATGTIMAGSRVGEVGPDGSTRSSGFGSVVNTRPVASAGVGALIAYIRMANGNLSPAYLVGSNLTTSVPMDGRLILAVNDDNYSDNSGSFSVTIRYQEPR